jgi:hypothetical protein
MFNFGLLASSTPYIIMALLCAVSYVWMLFEKKPAEQIACISTQHVDHDVEKANKDKTTYIVAANELKTSPNKYEQVQYIDVNTNKIVFASVFIAKLDSKTFLTQPPSIYHRFYFCRPPPFSC